MAVYVNEWGEREHAVYEVKRFLIGKTDKDPITTYHERKKGSTTGKSKSGSYGQI